MVLVRVERAIARPARGGFVRVEASAPERLRDRLGAGPRFVEANVHERVDEIEVERGDAGVTGERAFDQSGLFRTVHPMDVQTELAHQSAFTASSTASAWPSTLTLSQRLATLPSASIR